jgi:hypothetical protein
MWNVGAPTFSIWLHALAPRRRHCVGASLEAGQPGMGVVLACRAKARRLHEWSSRMPWGENVGAPTFPFWNCASGVRA